MRAALGADSPLLPSLGPVLGPLKSAFDRDIEQGEREEKTGPSDYAGAAFRQDSPIDGAMGWLVGSQMESDPNFDSTEPKSFAEDAEGIDEQFVPELYPAKSRNHRIYIRGRLLQKQADLQMLGDLGVPGNIGRFALGLVDPANLALGVGAGQLTRLVRGGATVARGSRMVTEAKDAAQLQAGLDVVAKAAKGPGVAAGLGGAFAGGYAFERLRQSVNFEDSHTDATIAALLGTAFAAPFVGLNARSMARVRAAAMDELRVADHLKAVEEGAPMTPEMQARAEELHARAAAIMDGDEMPPPREEPLIVEPPEQSMAALVPNEGTDVPNPGARVQESAVYNETVQAPAAVRSEGDVINWATEAGEFTGELARVGKDGVLVVKDADGKAHRVRESDVLPAPEGFLAGSVGSGQTAAVAPIERTAFASKRFDMFAFLDKSENQRVRQLNSLLVKDAIQSSDFYAQGRTASEEKRLLQRRVGNNFHLAARDAYDEAAKAMGWGLSKKLDLKHVASFYEAAGRLTRGEEGVLDLGNNRAIEPQLRKVATAARKVYDEMFDEMKKAGVRGADELAENPMYVNRIWNHNRINDLIRDAGKPAVVRLIAESIRVPGLRGDLVKAEAFLLAVQRLEHSHLSVDVAVASHDMKTLRRELTKANLKDDEIDSIIDTLFEKKAEGSDAGQAPNLKYRFQLDETQTLDVNGRTLALADLLENDSRVLVDRYMNSMGGHVALAKKGITSRADFMAQMREVDQDHELSGTARDAKRFADEKSMLEDIYANIVGRPMSVHSFNTGDRVAGTMRAFARASYLGQLGFTAGLEIMHAASLATFSAAFKQMPSFASFITSVRKGYNPGDELASDIRAMTGFGTEHAAAYARQHEISDFTYDKKLNALENFANRASHVVDQVSGNSFFTSFARGLAGKMMVQKYAHFATGKAKLDAAARKRLVGQGIDAGDIDHVMSQLRKHTDLDEGGRVDAIRWEDWSAKDPESYGSFITAIQREVRTGVQDHDLGETWFFQHTAIGKIFTELRAFSIAAHSKQFLNGLHYRDQRTLHLWVTGFVTQSLGYVLQTSMNFAHDDEKRAKMLTPEKIAFAAFKRMSVMGVLPLFAEPVLPSNLTGMTANTENRMPWITPSMMLGGRLVAGAGALTQSALYGENFTGKDTKNLFAFVPNTYGVRNLMDMVSKMAPKSELQPTP